MWHVRVCVSVHATYACWMSVCVCVCVCLCVCVCVCLCAYIDCVAVAVFVSICIQSSGNIDESLILNRMNFIRCRMYCIMSCCYMYNIVVQRLYKMFLNYGKYKVIVSRQFIEISYRTDSLIGQNFEIRIKAEIFAEILEKSKDSVNDPFILIICPSKSNQFEF